MRSAVLLLVGVAVVASLPTPEGPRNQADLLQLILSARPEDNNLVSGDEKIQPKEDVLNGQGQISAAPSVQVQEPTVVQLSEPVQESTNDAEQKDQVQSKGEPQQEDSDTNREDGQEQEPKVEQRKTEPEIEEIKEQSEPEVKQADEPNPEVEQMSPPEPEEQISKQQIPENEQENIQPQAEVKQLTQEPDIIQLPAATEAKKDTGIIVVGQEDTEIEPSFVDEPHLVVVDFPEGGEPHEVSLPQEFSQKQVTDFLRLFFPSLNYGGNEEPEAHVSEELFPLEPYSILDVIREPDDDTQIDDVSQEMPVISDASERQEDFPPGIFTGEGIKNPEFDNTDIIPEDPVLLNGEDTIVQESIPEDETYPVPLATDFTYPTEVEGPADELPLQDDVSFVDFFIPSHETPIYEGTGDETPFGMAPGEEFFQDEAPEEEFFQDEAPEEEFFQDEAPEEEFSRDEAPEEEFFQDEAPEEEIFHDEAPEEEFFHDEAPEEEFFHDEAPEEEFFHDETPEEEFFHDETPEEVFFHEEAPEEEFFHDASREEYFHEEIVPQVEEEIPSELGSYMSEEAVVLPEEVSDEVPTDEINIAVIVPEPDYVVPEDGPKGEVILSEFVPNNAPMMSEEQPLHPELPLEANSEPSLNPTLLEPLIPGIPVEEYAEFRDSVFPLGIMEDRPRPVPDREQFFMIEREETSSNSDSDVVDIFVMDGSQQDSEDTNAAMLPVAGEPVVIEEQPVPIAEFLEQPVPIAVYPENYREPIIPDQQPYRIPENNDDDRIIFPDDNEPPRSLPIFPHQWDEDSHFIPPEEEQTTADDSLHLLPVIGETQTEDMHPMSDDDMPPPFLIQPEIPQDIPDFMNSGFPQVPIGSVVPFFEPNHERDDTTSEIYIGSTMFQKPFQVPSSTQQNLNYYNQVRRQSSADYAFPHHIHRTINFPQHFHGPSSFPQHFHGPVSHPHPFSGPEMFSDYDGPLLPQNRDTEDIHPHPPTGPKNLVQEPVMHYEPFYGPSGEPPMKESSLSPLFRTSNKPVTFERFNQHEPQLDVEIYPIEMTFTPDDDSFAVSSYSSSPNQHPAYNFLHRPYFRTRHSSSYGDPVYIGPPMYPNTGLYPPTPTHSRYAPNFVKQQNNPYPTPTW